MHQLSGKKYVVTGGAGFIGSHICEEIVKQGKEVVCIDNVQRRENLEEWWNPSLCTFVDMDVRNIMVVDHLRDADAVFHNACSKCTVCRDNPVLDLSVNARGSLNIFNLARYVGTKVVHASTGSVNGNKPKSFYGVSKQAAEGYLAALKEYYSDFRYTALRYFHVFGTRQNSGEGGGVIPIFIRKSLTREPIEVFGDGSQVRHFTWVKDVVNANFIAAEMPETDGLTYDVVSDVTMTVRDLADEVADMATVPVDIIHSSERPGEIHRFNIDNSTAKSFGGWQPDNDFAARLKETRDWYAARL